MGVRGRGEDSSLNEQHGLFKGNPKHNCVWNSAAVLIRMETRELFSMQLTIFQR